MYLEIQGQIASLPEKKMDMNFISWENISVLFRGL